MTQWPQLCQRVLQKWNQTCSAYSSNGSESWKGQLSFLRGTTNQSYIQRLYFSLNSQLNFECNRINKYNCAWWACQQQTWILQAVIIFLENVMKKWDTWKRVWTQECRDIKRRKMAERKRVDIVCEFADKLNFTGYPCNLQNLSLFKGSQTNLFACLTNLDRKHNTIRTVVIN